MAVWSPNLDNVVDVLGVGTLESQLIYGVRPQCTVVRWIETHLRPQVLLPHPKIELVSQSVSQSGSQSVHNAASFVLTQVLTRVLTQ
eukprot:120559-Prorocentrum_minimum.AAC.1